MSILSDGARLSSPAFHLDGVGQGDDVLRAGSGSIQAVFNMGPVADGADRIFGGQRRSIVDYSERTRPMNVTLNFGGAMTARPARATRSSAATR
jgi:hypothetical protein